MKQVYPVGVNNGIKKVARDVSDIRAGGNHGAGGLQDDHNLLRSNRQAPSSTGSLAFLLRARDGWGEMSKGSLPMQRRPDDP
jgi:hypothetical protein